jgi:diaminopimelate epimerase
MGRPILEPAEIPFALQGIGPVIDHAIEVAGSKMLVTGVSMGNPHAVMFINKDVDDYPLHDIGPLVESHSLFPNKVNFEIVNLISRNRLKTRVWERGSGLTQACGTGACAAVVAAHLKGLVDDSVTVELPGGALEIYWAGQGEVIMEGPVAEVFEGEWLELQSM